MTLAPMCLLLVAFIPQASTPDAPSAAEVRWRAEYPGAAKKLEEIIHGFACEGRLSQLLFGGTYTVSESFQAAASGEKRLVIRGGYSARSAKEKPMVPGLEEVRCATPESTFHLRRTSRNGPYLILSQAPRMPDDEMDLRMGFEMTAPVMTRFGASTLVESMRSPDFALKAVVNEDADATELVRIDFTLNRSFGATTGSVWLWPARLWAIRRSDVVFTPNPPESTTTSKTGERPPPNRGAVPVRSRLEITYRDDPGGKPFPSRVVSTTTVEGSPGKQEAIFETKTVTIGDPPAERFLLSGYGLPDLPLRPTAQGSAFSLRNPWLWGSLALALVSFAALLATRKRHATATP